jgi:hypothetical protein
MNEISKTDINDSEIVDAIELASDGYYVYRTVSLVSTTSLTREVKISTPTNLDRLDNVDEPLQIGDRIEIIGNIAAGFYTVEDIIDPTDTFKVLESILDSTGGTADFIHPSGASHIGVNSYSFNNTSSTNLQEILEDFDVAITEADGYGASLPNANYVGQLLFSVDGTKFVRCMPITTDYGWIVNDFGLMVVNVDPEDDI